MVKDSGDRREFSSGAVRDMASDKGYCYLIPWDTVCKTELLDEDDKEILMSLHNKDFMTAVETFISKGLQFKSIYDALLEFSIHIQECSKKYPIDNWRKGIPLESYQDSALRHYLKFRRGDKDERHDRAFIWNCFCAEWTRDNIKEEVE